MFALNHLVHPARYEQALGIATLLLQVIARFSIGRIGVHLTRSLSAVVEVPLDRKSVV